MSDTIIADPAAVFDVPASIEAERAVLGAILRDEHGQAALEATLPVLRAEDFYRPAHQAIYRAALDLHQAGHPTSAIAMLDELDRHGDLVRAGGGPYLHDLVARGVPVALVDYHARQVAAAAVRRRLAEAGVRLTQQAHAVTDPDEVAELVQHVRDDLDAATEPARRDGTGVGLVDVLDAAFGRIEDMQTGSLDAGVPSGFVDLDDLIGGARPGQMITIAARPGVGKSTLGLDWARHAAIRQGRPVMFFSLEMDRAELGVRLVAAESRVRLDALQRKSGLSDREWSKITEVAGRIQLAPLFIDDAPLAGVTDIRARARQRDAELRRQCRARGDEETGLGMIVVDYLQLLTSGRRVESRQLEVSEFSRQLKLLAKELSVPVIAISQLNRGPEQRQDKKPMLADLRESGAIEQDSDLVILIHRPDAQEPDDPRAGEVDLIVAKNRGGRTGTVTVASQLHYAQFRDLARV